MRLDRSVAFRKFMLDQRRILQRRHDDDILAVFPIGGRSSTVAIGELQGINLAQTLVEIAASAGRVGDGCSNFLLPRSECKRARNFWDARTARPRNRPANDDS